MRKNEKKRCVEEKCEREKRRGKERRTKAYLYVPMNVCTHRSGVCEAPKIVPMRMVVSARGIIRPDRKRKETLNIPS